MSTASTRRSTAVTWVAIGALFAWGAYLSLWNLFGPNQAFDEPLYTDVGWQYVHGDLSANREHPPTAKLLFGLMQLLFGEGWLAPRVLAGVLTLGTGVILFLWFRRELRSSLLGALPAVFWLLLPRATDSAQVRLDRYALLEPVMVFFAVAAFAIAWTWYRDRRWWLAAASGVAMGLSVTSKVTTAVLLLAFVVLLVGRRQDLRRTLLHVAAFFTAFLVTCLAVLAPFGIRSSITYMVEFQGAHAAAGHLIEVAGMAVQFPPWWANTWFMFDSIGVVGASALVIAAVIGAVFGRPRRLVLFLGVAFVSLWVFYSFISDIALAHYHYSWLWLLAGLAGLGLAAVVPRRVAGQRAIVRVVVVALLLAGAAAPAVVSTVEVWQLRKTGTVLVPGILAERVPEGTILAAGMPDWEYGPLLGTRGTLDLGAPDIRAILVRPPVRAAACRPGAGRLPRLRRPPGDPHPDRRRRPVRARRNPPLPVRPAERLSPVTTAGNQQPRMASR